MRRSSIVKMLLSLLPVAALVAVVFWLVYVTKYDDQASKGPNDPLAYEYAQKAEIAFQAVVATILVYFVSHHSLGEVSALLRA